MEVAEEQGERGPLGPDATAARKRAAVETYSRNEAALRRTARRYSLCADDAEDALQRGLEILLRKAPTVDPRELIKWTQTVVKHEALAVRRERERILAGPAAAKPEPDAPDWVALIPAEADGPPERAERREAIARSREALQTLKPQELRALTLLAEGYSYAEIGEITGYSRTKINRCLAEGRERFRKLLSRSEDGSRCAEMRSLISAFCDGEAAAAEVTQLREHLRACAHCRATLRAYRAAPAAAAALAPLPLHRSLLERAHDTLTGLAAKVTGAATGDATAGVMAGGGTRGAGIALAAKVAAVCIGSAGGAAACVATGLVPAPLGLAPDPGPPSHLERSHRNLAARETPSSGVDYEPQPAPEAAEPEAGGEGEEKPEHVKHTEATQEPTPAPASTSGAVEYAPPPAEPAPEPPPASTATAGDPAGEFGP
ncbi:MAG TPA: sigma-70 family RNA polymerase sigma factor [Solirubrobacterales bacterium]|nr:sigma-70 family RNA polymerase sigma factor [Solirubrobacterales bacterium]